MQNRTILIAACLLAAGTLTVTASENSSEEVTTLLNMSDTLETARVTADKGVIVSRTDTIRIDRSVTVSEALMKIPGTQISDLGGYSGLKTAGLRGMGTANTSIYIDGVKVGNIQSGQGDLGMTGLENVSEIIVDYAQNSISFNTVRPSASRTVGGRASLEAGSFGTWLPYAGIYWNASDKVALSAYASGTVSKGNYPYALEDKTVSRRENNDIEQYRGGLDAFGKIKGGGWHGKAFFNSAERGTPGSISWPSEDRQKDINAFIQGTFSKMFGEVYSLKASAKGAYDEIYYMSTWGDSRYRQSEVQLSTSHIFRITEWLTLSAAAAGTWDMLLSESYSGNGPCRYSTTENISAKFSFERITADLAAEYTMAADKGKTRHALSPAASIRFRAFEGFDINAFARRAYRIPTFNELYYIGYGNPDLECEDAWLTDIGVQWNKSIGTRWTLAAKADGFANILKNKITSAPSAQDPAIWLPYNIGQVFSSGADICVSGDYKNGGWNIGLSARYSYQNAVDMTTDSYTYGQQIPYVARHTVVIDAEASYCGWRMNILWNSRNGRNDSSGTMPGWNTLDAGLDKTFVLIRKSGLSLKASLKVRNLTDCRYEISRGYPMPGRSFTGGLAVIF